MDITRGACRGEAARPCRTCAATGLAIGLGLAVVMATAHSSRPLRTALSCLSSSPIAVLRRSWRDPSGENPAQVRGSARLVASVASRRMAFSRFVSFPAVLTILFLLTDLSAADAREKRINGVCGSANGIAVSSAPTTGLCQTGSRSAVTGDGPWSWDCSGSDGGTETSCSAPLLASLAPYPETSLHYAPNGNFSSSGVYLPGADGFNMADIDNVDMLPYLPTGVKALVWLDLCNGADANFISTVTPFIGKSQVYGFYIVDEPDPTGLYKTQCLPANLKAESDWIHANVPGTKTFIVLQNLCDDTNPCYIYGSYPYYTPANTDIDLFGLDPYPCQTIFSDSPGSCNFANINAYVTAAAATGVYPNQIIPVYEAFGGGGEGDYILPTAAQEEQIWARWASLIAYPAFDYAYSWGVQLSDQALSTTPALQTIFLQKNSGQ
jgi:hypothetical protein